MTHVALLGAIHVHVLAIECGPASLLDALLAMVI
jgi:hypothetical protein